jgi:hypothetical protein
VSVSIASSSESSRPRCGRLSSDSHVPANDDSSEHRSAPGAVRAGDRAPDAPTGDGRVFDLLRGPHATLLAVGWAGDLPAVPAELPVHRIFDPAAAEIYDVREPTLFLVRPDNYIGCATTDPADLLAYQKLLGA